ncbi:MAG: L,D-transpeptidase family protein [Clostridia bacterium]|nr:L,D-transpeptidase family protein [Clostridia bacterium]
MLKILIEKQKRRLTVTDGERNDIFSCPIALGAHPVGPKEKEGDGKTPEGAYFICLKKRGKYGPSLGVSYPNEGDVIRMGAAEDLLRCIRDRASRGERPPWGSALGGEIYIHGGGTASDWTAGCIALGEDDAQRLYDLIPLGTEVRILP